MAIVIKVKCEFLEEVLGSAPSNENIYGDYIASKAPDAKKKTEEIAAVGTGDYEDRQTTIFPRDEEDNPFIFDYVIKGMLKDSCGFLRKVPGSECSKIKAFKKEIDGLIFPLERRIYFIPADGKRYVDIDYCQRPLRASTPMGDRNALAISETVPAGTKIEFRLAILDEKAYPMVKECLEYGAVHGFGQWRNSGKGRFSYEIEDKQTVNYADVFSMMTQGEPPKRK